MTDDDSKNQDLDENSEDFVVKKQKKPMKLTDEERKKRSDRMKLLRAKLDNIGSKPVKNKIIENKKEKVIKKLPTKMKEEDIKEEQETNNDLADIETDDSNESEEDIEEPILKKQKPKKQIVKNHRKNKPTPRKVMKIKYYAEPSQAEMLQDRLFLENQHKTDSENKYLKKKNQTIENDIDDLSNKLFNY